MRIYTKEVNALDYRVLKDGVEVKAGACLKMAEGGLVLCSATDKPEYISNITTVGDGNVIPVDKITPDAVITGELESAITDISVGAKLALSADGTMIVSGDGALEVVSFEGTDTDARVICVVK